MSDRNTIQFECPRCLTAVRASSENAGKRIACPGCEQSLVVPGQSTNQDLFDDLFEAQQPTPKTVARDKVEKVQEHVDEAKIQSDSSQQNRGESKKTTEADPIEIGDDPLKSESDNRPETSATPLEPKDPFEVDPDAPLKIDGISDKISHESVFGIKCSVCDTHIHVTPDQIGSQVECPECFTKLPVKRSKPAKKKSHGRWRQKPPEKSHIRSDDEYALSEPIERPKIDYNVDPSFGLGAVTEDLLAPKRSEEDTDRQQEKENEESAPNRAEPKQNNTADAKQKKSRRERLEAAQQRNQEQQKSPGLEVTPIPTEPTEQEDTDSRRFPDFDFGSLMSAVTRMFASPGLVWRMFVAWLLMGAGWAMMHQFANAYEAATATDKPTLGNWAVSFFGWFVLGALPFIAGTLLLWFICGYVFRNAASRNRQVTSWGIRGTSELSSTFLIFSFSFLVAGLPLLFVPFLITPFRFLIAPLLLLAAWYNGSPFAIVSVDAFENFRHDANQWKSFYIFIVLLVFLALVAGGLLMVDLFLLLWVFSLAGMAMIVTVTIAFAAVTGWHCGHVVQSLEKDV